MIFDSERMHLERERLWPRVWLLVDAVDRVARPGDWVVLDVGADSIVAVNDGGELRAFHNVCAHRGNRLCDRRAGRGDAWRCSYHGWCYGFDGRDELDRGALTGVRCERFAGFVWVCMTDDAPPLAEFLGPVAARLAAVDLEHWHRTADVSVDIACNWLLSADAHCESYHVPTLHPGVEVTGVKVELLERHGRLQLEVDAGGVHTRSELLAVFPNVQLNVYDNSVQVFRHRPHASDPQRCSFDKLAFATTASDEVIAHRWVDADDPTIGPVTAADLHMSERVQRGVRSRGFGGPRFTSGEQLLANTRAHLDEYLT